MFSGFNIRNRHSIFSCTEFGNQKPAVKSSNEKPPSMSFSEVRADMLVVVSESRKRNNFSLLNYPQNTLLIVSLVIFPFNCRLLDSETYASSPFSSLLIIKIPEKKNNFVSQTE